MLLRRSRDRGFANHGWLQSYHSFSFANYFDRNFMSFGDLRVINDDLIAGNSGFDLHPHSNMEIITFVLKGAITHGDNLGNSEEISAGNFQVMSAGSGIIHSEFNRRSEVCRLLQIWIKPSILGGAPYYRIFSPDTSEKFTLIASPTGEQSSIKIRQDAEVWVLDSQNLDKITDTILPKTNKNLFWLHIAEGEVDFWGIKLSEGDAIAGNFMGFEEKFYQEKFGRNIHFKRLSKILLFYLK